METNRTFYVGIVFLLLAVDCSFLSWKVNVMAKTDSKDPNNKQDLSEQTGVSNSVSDSNKGTQFSESMESIDRKSNNGKNKNNDDKSGQSSSRKPGNVEKENGKSNEKSQVMGDVDEKKKTTLPKENGNQGDSAVSVKDSHVEDCDPSNKCIDDENKFFACLRVPGNDRQYSLLIQNKGKKPLLIAISAPDFVRLEKSEIQLPAEGNRKVEVSISKEGSEKNSIVLKAGKGHCNLDIKHLITENSNSEKSTDVNFMPRTQTIALLSFAALLLVAAGWAFVSFRKKQLSAGGAAKYRRLDAVLLVSTGAKPESELEQSQGWDNSWGDDWDDEEAPKTPSMPLTPSLSAKGLASRRLSKEGWKD